MKILGNIAKWLGIGVYVLCAFTIVMFMMPIGGWKALNVLTGSMKPALQPGDLVIIHRVALRDIRPGDIVTFTNPNNPQQTITHRVVSQQTEGKLTKVTTKGDANPQADPAFPGGRIVGRVALVVPAAGHAIGWLHHPLALAALVIIPGLLIMWAEVRNLRRLLATPAKSSPRPKSGPPDPPAPPQSPPPPPGRPLQAHRPNPRPPARSRSLDGMRRLAALSFTGAVSFVGLSLIIAPTWALSQFHLQIPDNTLTAVVSAPSPSPTPCAGSVIVQNTGPGSGNVVVCHSSSTTTTTNANTVVITNTSTQSSTTGSVSGSGSSGSASNANSTQATVNVSNF